MTEQVTPIPKVSYRGRRQKGARAERAIASEIRGTRTANAFGTADVSHDRYSVEVKARARFAFIEKAFSQAEAAIPTGSVKAPLVVLKPDGAPAIYCLRSADFQALLSGAALERGWEVRQKLRAIARLAREALDGSR